MPRDTLLLIDGHALVYRAFFAMPALTNTRGEMTNATYGFTSMLLKVLAEEHPTHAIAAFDPKGPTFRHEQDETYKANRPEMPSDLRPQLPWSQEICTALGIPLVMVPGFEADDVIGTLSLQAEAAGMNVIILTGDLDALQLVTDSTVVYAPKRGISETVIYDVGKVDERFGFAPPKMIDYKALRGDPSDNIPGIPGIGEKTGMSLIQQYGDLEGVLAAIPEMKAGKLRQSLEEYSEQARHSRVMATIRRDVDITLDVAGALIDGYDETVVRELFDRLEFRSLLPRLPASGDVQPEPVAVEPLFGDVDTEVIRDAGVASAMAERLRDGGGFAMRTLADAAGIAAIALADLEGDHAYLIPLGDTLDRAVPEAEATVTALLADATVPKHAYDLKREMVLWHHRGVELRGLGWDLMLAAYLVNTRTRVASPSVLAKDLCGIEVVDDDVFVGSGRTRRPLNSIEADELATHAGAWVAAIGPVETALRRQLDAAGVTPMLDTLEMPLIPILAAMEEAGVRVDKELFAHLSVELGQRISAIEAEVHGIAGHAFNPGSTQQLATVLYDELGLAAGRRTKTGRSTDADTLDSLREEHPVVALVLEWRQLTKLRGTYVDALPQLCDAASRIHTSYGQAVATTGRLSSSDPNLQNIPVRSEWGMRIRRGFVAGPGMRLVSADYSQIELRVLAHLSEEDELVAAFQRGEDVHRRTAAEVYGVDAAAVTPDMRRIAKVVNFGVLYGLSDFGLSRDTGMPRAEAAAFIERYFASFPKVTTYLESIRNHAREYGWVETLMGRRRHLPDIRAANRQLRNAAERMAVNMPMQGTAADIMKVAMISTDTALRESGTGGRVLLQVHDELVVEASADAADVVGDVVRAAMAGAAELRVPLVVDVKAGDNWADMKPVAAAAVL